MPPSMRPHCGECFRYEGHDRDCTIGIRLDLLREIRAEIVENLTEWPNYSPEETFADGWRDARLRSLDIIDRLTREWGGW